jgi:hypothetical protein
VLNRLTLLLALTLACTACADPAFRPKLDQAPIDLPDDLRQPLAEALHAYDSADPEARIAATNSIVKIMDACADRFLLKIFNYDGSFKVRMTALRGLQMRENADFPPHAARMAAWATPPSFREACCDLIRRRGAESASVYLRKVLQYGVEDESDDVTVGMDAGNNSIDDIVPQVLAAQALGMVGHPTGVDTLKSAVAGAKHWEVRAAAARGLGDAGDRSAIANLVGALGKDEDADVCIEAMFSLARFGGAEALGAIRRARKHRKEIVGAWAARILKRIEPPPGGGGAGAGGNAPKPPEHVESGKPGTKALPPGDPTSPLKDTPSVFGDFAEDLCIVVDTTFSMQLSLPGVRQEIREQLQRRPADAAVRLGVVVYRDRGNVYFTRQLHFTYDLEKAGEWLMEMHATGSNRDGSGVARGLMVATMLNWKKEVRKTLLLFGDEPPTHPDDAIEWASILNAHDDIRIDVYHLSDNAPRVKPFLRIAEAGGGRARYFEKRQETGEPSVRGGTK